MKINKTISKERMHKFFIHDKKERKRKKKNREQKWKQKEKD